MKKIPLYFKGKLYKLVKVDAADYEECILVDWRLNGNYAVMSGAGNKPRMHNYILDRKADKWRVVDHINGDTFDNRRENLRICSTTENSRNRLPTKNKENSIYKGVFKPNRTNGKTVNMWFAAIRLNGELIQDHGYLTEKDAAHGYDNLARKHFGSFSSLNFPDEVVFPEKYKTKVGKAFMTVRNRGKSDEFYVQISAKMTKGKAYVKYFNNLEAALIHRNEKLLELGIPIPD